jgi:hypothetical protein
LGVDTAAFADGTEKVDYVEKDPLIIECARHNLDILGHNNIFFHQDDATTFLNDFENKVNGIYIDPLRRPGNNRVFLFEDCDPDVTMLQDQILQKADRVMVKASPMIDITYALKSFKNVYEIYIIAIRNEVKEVLVLMKDGTEEVPEIEAVNIKGDLLEQFVFNYGEEARLNVELSEPLTYLYEPNTAILKAGAFKSFADQFDVKKLHQHSHLYTSSNLFKSIPGRTFKIIKTETYQGGKPLKQIGRANITTRNFKMSAEEIRKRFNIRDGGDNYLFLTTNVYDVPIILHTEKII